MPTACAQTQLGAIALLQQTASVLPDLAVEQQHTLRPRDHRSRPAAGIVLTGRVASPDFAAAIVNKAAATAPPPSTGQRRRAAMLEKIAAFARRARSKGRARPRRGFATSENGENHEHHANFKELGYVPTSVPVPSHLDPSRQGGVASARDRAFSLDSNVQNTAESVEITSDTHVPNPDAPPIGPSHVNSIPRITETFRVEAPRDLEEDLALEQEVASHPCSASIFHMQPLRSGAKNNCVAVLPKVGRRADTAHRLVDLPRAAALAPRRYAHPSLSSPVQVIATPAAPATSSPARLVPCSSSSSLTNSSRSTNSNQCDASENRAVCVDHDWSRDGDSTSNRDPSNIPLSPSMTSSPFLSSAGWDSSPPIPKRRSVHPAILSLCQVKSPRFAPNAAVEWSHCPTSPSAVTASEDCNASRASIGDSNYSDSYGRRPSNECSDTDRKDSESESVDMAERIASAVVEISSDDGDGTSSTNLERTAIGSEDKILDVGGERTDDDFGRIGAQKVQEISACGDVDTGMCSASLLERSAAFPEVFVPQRRAKTSLEENEFSGNRVMKLAIPDITVRVREDRFSAVTPDSLAEDSLGTGNRDGHVAMAHDDFINFMFDETSGTSSGRSGSTSLINFGIRSQSQRVERNVPALSPFDDVEKDLVFDRSHVRHSMYGPGHVDDPRKSSSVRRALARARAIARLN